MADGRISLIESVEALVPDLCSYCRKPITPRHWFNPFVSDYDGRCSQQCSRLWCRIRTGHLVGMLLHRKLHRRVIWRRLQLRLPIGLKRTY